MTLGMFDFGRGRVVGIGDDQQREEHEAQKRLAAAVAEMRAAIEAVNHSSALVEIEPSAFDDFVSDELPSADYWGEKLAAALRLDA